LLLVHFLEFLAPDRPTDSVVGDKQIQALAHLLTQPHGKKNLHNNLKEENGSQFPVTKKRKVSKSKNIHFL